MHIFKIVLQTKIFSLTFGTIGVASTAPNLGRLFLQEALGMGTGSFSKTGSVKKKWQILEKY